MSQEEKAQAYDEALERARKATRAGSDVAMDIVQYIFPQLAESEEQNSAQDTELTDFESALFTAFSYAWQSYLRGEEVNVAQWAKENSAELLEAARFQQEKPVENTLQLTVQGKGVYKICPRCKERMVRDNTKVYTSMPPQYGYKCPKCGEIEFDTAMYDNPEIEEQRPISFYGHYNPDDYEVVTEGNAISLKKKEQKPADLSEMMIHKEPYIAPVPTPMVADEQKSIDYDAELEKCKHNFLYFWDKYVTVKLKKPKWSKEDEEMLQSIIKDFRDGNISSIGQEQWLKSLPERFNLQPKQEWSEEDESCWNLIWDILDGPFACSKEGYKKASAWFLKNCPKGIKSLHPHWKPSEEKPVMDSNEPIEWNPGWKDCTGD